MRSTRVLLATSYALVVSACSVGLDVPATAQITCASDDQCPSPYLCRTNIGRCVLPGAEDQLPSVSNVVNSGQYTGPQRPLVISFDASKALQRDPVVRLGSPSPAVLTLSAHYGLHYTFTRTPGAGDDEGAWPVLVDLVDTIGNTATGVALGTVVVDLTPPFTVSPIVLYTAAPGNPLERVSALSNGTTVGVHFSTSERIDGDPVVYAQCGATRLDLTRVVGETSDTFFSYALTLEPIIVVADGDCTVRAELVDLAANPNSSLDLAALSIDRTPPDPSTVFDMSRVRHLRVPYGALQMGGVTGQLLARRDQDAESNPVGTVIDSAFVVPASGESIVELRAYPSAVGGELLGRLRPTDAGWPVDLFHNDAAELWLTAIDASGNESVRRRVPDSEWVVTLGGKVPNSTFENPATLQVVTYASPTLSQPVASSREATASEYAATISMDAQALAVSGEGLWTRRLVTGATPEGRYRTTMAFDPVSGESFLFGGYYNDSACYYLESAKLWGWNGYRWDNTDVLEANRPLPRDGVQLAVDGRRGRLVLFGGAYQSTYGDTWEWDIAQKRWFNRTPDEPDPYNPVNSPQARSKGGMVFDSARGLTYVFGGYYYGERNDLWQWDGATGTWSEITATGTIPTPRQHFGMTYDESRDVVVLFGGYSYPPGGGCPADSQVDYLCYFGDTYEWSPATLAWTKTGITGSGPAARFGHGFAYDSVGQASYLFGGDLPANGVQNDVWTYDGTGWHQPTLSGTKPPARGHTSAAFDSNRGRLVIHGGDNISSCNTTVPPDTWELDVGTHTWLAQTPSSVVPEGRERHAMMSGGPNGDVFMFGGYHSGDLDDLWRYSARTNQWTQLSPLGAPVPPANAFNSARPQVAYDWGRNVVVVVGEVSSGSAAMPVWEFNVGTATWSTPAQGGTIPYPRAGFALAYDASRSRVVMFGGQWTPSTTCPDGSAVVSGVCMFRDFREWNGATWALRTYSGGPLARSQHLMEFDPSRNMVLVAGGLVASGQTYDGAWAWNGAGASGTWTQLSPGTYSDTSSRFRHALAVDMARDKLCMLAGTNDDPFMEELDVPNTGWTSWATSFGGPQPDQFKGMAYDQKTQQVVVFGGDLSLDELWTWDGGAQTGPAIVLEVPLASSGIDAAVSPDKLALRVHAQGQGSVGRTGTPGYEVMLWNGTAWEAMGIANPTQTDRQDVALTGGGLIARRLYGPLRRIQAAVRSGAPNGKGAVPAQVSLDAIELRLHVTYP